MSDETKDLNTLVQEQISADTDFQDSLVDLSEEEQTTAVSDKEVEVRDSLFASLSEKAKKSEDNYQNQKIRAKKAEGTAKKPEGVETPKNDHSMLDIRALNKVHDDDVEKVQKFAKTSDLSIVEAMKDEDLLAILKGREERRKTAEATATTGARQGGSTSLDKEILHKIDNTEEMSDSERKTGAKLMVEALKGNS